MLSRQQDRDRGPLAEFAAHLDGSAGLMGKTVDLREAQPGALADRFGGEEGIEYLAQHVRCDTGAGVVNRNRDVFAGIGFFAKRAVMDGNRDRSAVRHRIARVDHEIDQRGLEFGDVDHDRPDASVDIELQPHRAVDAGVENIAHRIDSFGDIDRLRIDALPPRESQQLVGQCCAAPCCRLDRRYRTLTLWIVINALLECMEAAADDHQEIVEIMRYAAGKLAERVELLRFRQLPLHLLELELGLAALGNVAGDLGEADEFAFLPNRIDHDAGPEKRPVLADTPALFFIAAGFFGDAERAGGFPVGAVGFGVEAGEVPADNLLGRITLDAYAADIPAGDDPGRIEHVERVVGYIFDQKPETA